MGDGLSSSATESIVGGEAKTERKRQGDKIKEQVSAGKGEWVGSELRREKTDKKFWRQRMRGRRKGKKEKD